VTETGRADKTTEEADHEPGLRRNRPDATGVLGQVRVPAMPAASRSASGGGVRASSLPTSTSAGAKLVVIGGAGHPANLEQPAAFNAAVREFVRRG
jgi:pimeloyl-ACP methyl ester carboxylesterase